MQGENKERWMELCAQAVVEQDPRKLFELAKEINYLLEEERRLGGESQGFNDCRHDPVLPGACENDCAPRHSGARAYLLALPPFPLSRTLAPRDA